MQKIKIESYGKMSQTYEFLKQCGTFIITTINDNVPAARPFGAVMEYESELYVSTANYKDVYSQFIKNPAIQIVAFIPGTRDWIRVNGLAVEVFDLNIKQAMLDSFPVLVKRFESKECAHFSLFKVAKMTSVLHTANDTIVLQ